MASNRRQQAALSGAEEEEKEEERESSALYNELYNSVNYGRLYPVQETPPLTVVGTLGDLEEGRGEDAAALLSSPPAFRRYESLTTSPATALTVQEDVSVQLGVNSNNGRREEEPEGSEEEEREEERERGQARIVTSSSLPQTLRLRRLISYYGPEAPLSPRPPSAPQLPGTPGTRGFLLSFSRHSRTSARLLSSLHGEEPAEPPHPLATPRTAEPSALERTREMFEPWGWKNKKEGERLDEVKLRGIPQVKVVETWILKGCISSTCVFVVQISVDGFEWKTHIRARDLLGLLLSVESMRLLSHFYGIPPELLQAKPARERAKDSEMVEKVLTALLLTKRTRGHPKLMALLGVGSTTFSRAYGHSLKEGVVHMRLTLNRGSKAQEEEEGTQKFLGVTLTRRKLYACVQTLALSLLFALPFTLATVIFTKNFVEGKEVNVTWDWTFSVCILLASLVPLFFFFLSLRNYFLRIRYWAVVKPSCIAFYKHRTSTLPSHVVLLDDTTVVEKRGLLRRGLYRLLIHGLVVRTQTFTLELSAGSQHQQRAFFQALQEALSLGEYSKRAREASSFSSFAPRRPALYEAENEDGQRKKYRNYCTHLVDGEETYRAMLEALQLAQREIFLAGWWLTPELFLVRGESPKDSTRLDRVLREKAEQGVQVYVLLFKEVKIALPNDSWHTKHSLRSLHQNIHVLRWPDFILSHLGFWSHHEKLVVVDQRIGFVGGLDLCLGRYDTPCHFLSDVQKETWPGKDYSNPRIKDFVNVKDPWTDQLDRKRHPRMPWHDVHCRIIGPAVKDICRHFIHRWNFVRTQRFSWLFRSGHFAPAILPAEDPFLSSSPSAVGSYLSVKAGPQSRDSGAERSSDEDGEDDEVVVVVDEKGEVCPGVPRSVEGDEEEVAKMRRCIGCPLLPISLDPLSRLALVGKGGNRANEEAEEEGEDPHSACCHVQVLRSCGFWSCGVGTERSIQDAYIQLIDRAEHFIYIENQFFVSSFTGDAQVENRVVEALYRRILRAEAQRETFRVLVILPLLPAFEGSTQSRGFESANLRAVMFWQYKTISRGGSSLLERLQEKVRDPTEYIAFLSLRRWERLGSEFVTEQVYVHSKMMIVDDRLAIIGSANINDRSMVGNRDSEMAVVLEDSEFICGTLNGQPQKLGKFCHGLRMRLLSEHLGLRTTRTAAYRAMLDICSQTAWQRLRQTARRNTEIYWKIFQAVPADEVIDAGLLVENTVWIYEHERARPKTWPGSDWSARHLLPSDPPHWCTAAGAALDENQLDLSKWQIVRSGGEDAEGWVYSSNFKDFDSELQEGDASFSPSPRRNLQRFVLRNNAVRRRRWVREEEDLLRLSSSSCVSSSFSIPGSRRAWSGAGATDASRDVELLIRQCSCVAPQSQRENTSGSDKSTVELEKALGLIRGKLVEFPLRFLEAVDLRPKILPRYLHI